MWNEILIMCIFWPLKFLMIFLYTFKFNFMLEFDWNYLIIIEVILIKFYEKNINLSIQKKAIFLKSMIYIDKFNQIIFSCEQNVHLLLRTWPDMDLQNPIKKKNGCIKIPLFPFVCENFKKPYNGPIDQELQYMPKRYTQ